MATQNRMSTSWPTSGIHNHLIFIGSGFSASIRERVMSVNLASNLDPRPSIFNSFIRLLGLTKHCLPSIEFALGSY